MQQPRASSLSTLRVVAIPAFVSLGVTLLRLVGELRDWPKPLVNNDVCGKAILGVAWLVPIFGIYFAVKLFHAGHAPQRFARPMLLAVSALALKLAGTFVMESQEMTYIPRLSTNFIVTLIGLVLSAKAWPSLSKALLVYGYLSRIPIAIVQYLAMRGRWGTHYDALDPGFPSIGFWPTFFRVSFVPNFFFMEVYTVIVGALVGIAAFAVPGLRGLEEVCRDQVLGMVLEKGPPSLRGRFSVPEPYIWQPSPERLRFQSSAIPRECVEHPNVGWPGSFDESVPELPSIRLGGLRSSDSSISNRAEALALPGDDGLRLDDEQCRPPIVPQPGEPSPQNSVSRTEGQSMATVGAL